MRIGRSLRQHELGGPYDAVVIGSGIGGLASATLLAKFGNRRVLVLERHYTAGGFTHTFHRPGFEWDVGVHYVGDTGPKALLGRVFEHLTDGELEWADMGDVYDRVVIDGESYELARPVSRLRGELATRFPRQAGAIDRYLELIGKVARSSRGFFAEKALPGPLALTLGSLLRRPALTRYARRTTLEVMRELFSDERLIGVLTAQYGDYGLPPSQSSFFVHALVANHFSGGAAYPVGGSSRIAATMLPLIERAGGAVLTMAEVSEVLVEGGRARGVRLSDGREVRAPLVISDAGARLTFGKLLPAEAGARHRLVERLERLRPSAATATLYVGLRGTAAELGLPKANVWVYPTHDHDRNLARFVADPEAPLPLVFISFPSAKDPDFERRHPGRATIEVVTVAPWEWFRRWEDSRWRRRGAQYESLKARLTERLLTELRRQVPQVEGRVEHAELSTPLSTRHFTGHPEGEIYGLEHTPPRFEERWLRPQTPIRGLFLTGSDVCTAGIGGALFGGVLTAAAVLGRNLLAPLSRPARRARPGSRARA